ncbi:signal transduction histidine kinase [Sporomusaceae bacterium BoRhaA]|nr:signal transduction histidine kinase [Pelorhabdus rhamnosifermentans]
MGNHIWIYLFDMAMMEALAIYTWQFRKLPGAMYYIACQVCKGAWILFFLLSDRSDELSVKMFWSSLQEMVAVLLPYLWFLFIWHLSKQENEILYLVKYGFLGIIGFLWLVILSNFWQGLYWSSGWVDGQNIEFGFGLINWLVLGNSYLLCVISTVLSVRWVSLNVGLRRRQALWFVMPELFPWLGHMMMHIPACCVFVPPAFGVLLSGVFAAWAYYRWKVYRILPLAQELAARNRMDGWLVIDEQDYLVEMNVAAKTMLNGLPAAIGARFREVVASWSHLDEFYRNSDLENCEVMREYPEGYRYFRLNRIFLKKVEEHLLGQIILVTDITRQKQEEAKRIGQEKAQAVLYERNRLGRELHDGAGQFPGYVKVQTQVIQLLLQKGQLLEAREQLKTLSQVADAAFSNVREAINSLKGNVGEWNFFNKLQDWLEQFRKMTGITIVSTGLEGMSSSRMMPEAEVQLLRIIQEVLANVRKHSGAHSIQLAFTFVAGQLVVKIFDDGCGFDVKKMQTVPGKFGLHIIMERAEEIGGTCKVQSILGQGTLVTIEIPLCYHVK